MNKIICGDAKTELAKLPAESINCCISSPPYWALRDYGVDGQLGLEPTFEEYIDKLCSIYDEVKRVLRKDGTCFVNLGDTYANTGVCGGGSPVGPRKSRETAKSSQEKIGKRVYKNVPIKSLCLIPQRFVIEMCRQRGKYVKAKENQIWLAALVDGEGCIAIHRRTSGRKNPTYGATLSVYNTCKELIDKAQSVAGGIGSRRTKTDDTPRNAPVHEWRLMSNNAKDVLRDIYPYLIAKKYQARAAIFCPSNGKDAEESWLNIKATNQFNSPTREYPEPKIGSADPWILRNTIIWKKPNPMPSSAKDRFTVDFEYVYFFVKNNQPLWYFRPDGKVSDKQPDYKNGVEGLDYEWGTRKDKPSKISLWRTFKYWFEPQYEPLSESTAMDPRTLSGTYTDNRPDRGHVGTQNSQGSGMLKPNPLGRNKRTVWTIPTQAEPAAHFATFPNKLVEPMIKAGCPEFVCQKCGKAREKIYEKGELTPDEPRYKPRGQNKPEPGVKTAMTPAGSKQGHPNFHYETTFKGYTDCGCNAGWRPGIALDMFCGNLHGSKGSSSVAA